RMQDLLRWGEGAKMAKNGDTYPELQVNGQVKNISCGNPSYGFKSGKNERLPYPATEIRLNSAIKQNPGY
ncbi:MAG: RagB/SusD family nutrient uptake outer membrane protein, partial [Bacteroidales bacterium]|nr:RagB/SusD family nutrient uptake outer membrane protein [Bacteroidales bacterium]